MANLSPKTGISIVDLTSHPRTGIKGRDLSPWIQTTGYEIGAESNCAYLQSDGILVARLSPGELLLLADPFVPSDETNVFSLEDDYQCYSVRRQDSHYWFSLAGALCSDMFAKLCSVDLSGANFPNHSIAQHPSRRQVRLLFVTIVVTHRAITCWEIAQPADTCGHVLWMR